MFLFYNQILKRQAKKENLGFWKNSNFPSNSPSNPDSTAASVISFNSRSSKLFNGMPTIFKAKVMEIGAGDSLIIQNPVDTCFKRIFFSSTIFSKRFDHLVKGQQINNSNRIFLIPYLFEAREYLRQNFLGKVLNFNVDYIVQASDYAPERICCTVTHNSV